MAKQHTVFHPSALALAISLSLTPALIGLSRIYLGVHYSSDVVAGYLAAIAMVFGFMSALNIYLSVDGVGVAFRPVRVGSSFTP